MNTLFARLAQFSAERRASVVCLLLVITSGAMLGHFHPSLITSLWQSPPSAENAPQLKSSNSSQQDERPPSNVSPLSLSRADAVLVVECDEFFTPEAAAAMRHVVAELQQLEQVSSILWIDNVPVLNIFGLPEPLLPKSTASAARFADAKKKALQHPLVAGQLLSDDTHTMLLLLGFDYFHLLQDADATTAIRDRAAEAAKSFPELKLRFRVTGQVPSFLAAIDSHERNQFFYQVVGYGMILLMAIILFRGIRAVLIVALAPLTGVFWTLGYIRFLGHQENPLIDVILPILVSLVGLTDGVHLMVQIRKLRVAGESRQQAARLGLQQVGLACFLTSLTTAIGFGSLMLADSKWVQEFGLCSTIGVLLVFIAVVTVIPLACSSWLGNSVHVGHENSLVDRNLNRIGVLISLVLRHRRPVAAVAITSTVALCAIGFTLRPDQRRTDGLPGNAEATQALLHVDRAFGGLEFSVVDINWEKSVPSDSAEIFVVVRKVDELLRAEPLIGHPLSIRNLLDAQPGSGPPEERMTLMELLPPPLKRAFYTPEYRTANVTFRVQDLGIAAYGPVFTRIEDGLRRIAHEHPQFTVQLQASGAVWRWKNLYQIVVDLAASLGTASIIILIVLAIVYRSLRLGLISIIPNVFPLALTAAYLAVTGYNLEIVMVCSFTVCLGIAVDDTIHFLTRYKEERLLTDDDDLAIQRAFTGVGTALIMTTIVLVAGFSVVTFSDSRDHQIFAVMGALTIASALICDLIFLPALLSLFGSQRT
ncbi:MAG: MMPL family transporter [Pirellulaceae bacterium]